MVNKQIKKALDVGAGPRACPDFTKGNHRGLPLQKELPEGWTASTIGDTVDILDSQRVPVNAKEREKRKGSIPYYGATGQVGWIDDYLFDEELLLLGEDGAPFLDANKQKAYIIRGKSWVNNHAHVLKVKNGIPNAYIKYYLDVVNYQKFVTGTTRFKLNQSAMRQIPIPIAPSVEQTLIVSEIEKQFSRLDEAVAALKSVRASLKRYKASVLKAAVEGKLTEEWRKAHPNVQPASEYLKQVFTERKLKSVQAVIPVDSKTEIPDEWVAAPAGLLCEIVDGDRGKEYPTKDDFKETGYCLFLSTKNVRPNGFLFEENQFIDKEKHERLRKGKLERGDIVFTSRGTVGNIAYYDDNVKYNCLRINSGMFILRSFSNILEEKFFEWYLRSSAIRNQIAKLKSGTAQPQLPIREFKNFTIIFPSKAEQVEIIKEIESRLSVAEEIEETIDINLKRAERLRQAILKKAFSGHLINADQNGNKMRVRTTFQRSIQRGAK